MSFRVSDLVAQGIIQGNSAYATIFYDSANTGYYLDPNSVSNLYNAYIGRVLIDWDGTDTWFRMQSGNRMRITTTGGTDFIIPNTGNMTYNGNVVWHAGNDGSGSGLDADLLDGINSGSFLRSDVVGATVIGTILSTNNANVDGPNFNVNTTSKTVNEYAYRVSRSGSAVGGILIDGRGVFASGTTVNGSTVWHQGNLTNLNQLTNGPGYITSYTETDTLATVTGRGASTSTALTLNGTVTFTSAWAGGSGDLTNVTNPSYKVSPVSGYWRIVHTSSNSTISGVYNYETNKDVYWGEPSDSGSYYFRGRTLRVENNSGTYVVLHSGNYNSYAPTLTGGGASGTWGISVSGTAAGETLSTVTGRGASTSTSVTFNNVLRVVAPANTFEFALKLAKGNHADTGGHTTLIGFGCENSGWSRSAIGHTRTTSYDAGYLGFYVSNNTANGNELVAADLRMMINRDGNIGINTASPSFKLHISGTGYATSDFRAPIFYDSDNTAYYGDFAGTSNMYRLQLGGGAGGTYAGLTVQAVTGNTGPIVAKSSSYATTWSILPWSGGDTYISTGIYYDNGTWVHASDNTTNALFRFSPSGPRWYSSNNSSGSWNVASDVPLWNSVARWVNNVTAPDDVRAPIFYDSQNTSYYLDPNATTSIRTVGSWRSDSSAWDGEFSGKIQYHSNSWYIQAASQFIYRSAVGNNVFTVNQSGDGVFSGSLTTNGQVYINNGDPTIFLQDTNHRSSMIHCNSNVFYILRGSGTNSTGWTTFNGYWPMELNLENNDATFGRNISAPVGTITAGNDMRAPIFYDSNDTTYYADFANSGTSIYTAGIIRSSGVQVKGSSGGGQIYPTMSNGGVSLYGGNSFTNGAYFTVTGIDYASSPGAGSAEFVIRSAASSKFALFSYNGSTWTGRYGLFGATGNVTIGDANTDIGYRLYVIGDIYATGNIIAYSDERVKTNVRKIENPLDRILNTRGVVYDRTDTDDKNQIGFIAQELEEHFPELISTSTDGRKGVKYQNMVAVLIEAMKEQQKQIEELKNK